MSTDTIHNGMLAVALAAGERLRELFLTKDLNIREKSGPGDLVTKADIEATEIALELLERYFPGVHVVGEESGGEATDSECFFLDPLDGTLNFVHGYPEFAISLGFWKGASALAGVVYNPISRNCYTAVSGHGAYKNGAPIRSSHVTALASSLIGSGWPYDRSRTERNVYRIGKIRNLSQDIRTFGSAALALCLVAEGVLDGYFEEGLDSWDIAAGAVIAQEAGARVSDFESGEFFLREGEIMASGAGISAQLAEALRIS